jgi:hypothetical protein
MLSPTKIALAALGVWLYWRVHKTADLRKREQFPVPGAEDADSIPPHLEHRAMVGQFRDAQGNLI